MKENHNILTNLFPLFKAFNSLKIRQKWEKNSARQFGLGAVT